MEQKNAYEILFRNQVIEDEFDQQIDYVQMLKEFNGYAKMYGRKPLK